MREESRWRRARVDLDAMTWPQHSGGILGNHDVKDLPNLIIVNGRREALYRVHGIDGKCNAPETGALRIFFDSTYLTAQYRPVLSPLDHVMPFRGRSAAVALEEQTDDDVWRSALASLQPAPPCL